MGGMGTEIGVRGLGGAMGMVGGCLATRRGVINDVTSGRLFGRPQRS